MAEDDARGGRPRSTDRATISALGLELLIAQGWADTSMAQIAAECSISSATLFRYFPSKTELFWFGMEHNLDLFETDLAHQRGGPLDAVVAAYLAMLHQSEQLPLIHARMALVARDPHAAQATAPVYDRWRDVVIAFVAERLGDPADSLAARSIGAATWATVWAAMTTWASAPEHSDPAPLLRAAFTHLTDAVSPPPGRSGDGL